MNGNMLMFWTLLKEYLPVLAGGAEYMIKDHFTDEMKDERE